MVYFNQSAEKLILSQPLAWCQEEQAKTHPYQRSEKKVVNHFEDIATSLPLVIASLLEKHEEIDLAKSYADNPLMALVRERILSQTTKASIFEECKAKLTSNEISKKIEPQWQGFVDCPWSADIRGTLALAKYYAENGERARFWTESIEGHYGFRLRTRDHDWITGEIFIDPSKAGEPQSQELKINSIAEEEGYGSSYQVDGRWVVSWQNMFLTVSKDQ